MFLYDNRPNGASETGKLIVRARDYLSTQGVSVDDAYIKGNRAYRFSLNDSANPKRIGSNPGAGKFPFTGSEADVGDTKSQSPYRTDAEWEVLLAQLDSETDELH